MSCHCHCHRSALEREFDFIGDLLFWAMFVATLWYIVKAVFWVLSKGIPWLLVGLWSFLTWVFSGIDRCFSLGLGVVASWRAAAEGRKVERRRRALEEQRLLQEKVTIAIAAVDGPDAALSLEALERLRDYAKEGSGEAALFVSRAFREGVHVPRNEELADEWYAFFVKLQARSRKRAEGGTDWRKELREQKFDGTVLLAAICVAAGVISMANRLWLVGGGLVVAGLLAGCLLPRLGKLGGKA